MTLLALRIAFNLCMNCSLSGSGFILSKIAMRFFFSFLFYMKTCRWQFLMLPFHSRRTNFSWCSNGSSRSQARGVGTSTKTQTHSLPPINTYLWLHPILTCFVLFGERWTSLKSNSLWNVSTLLSSLLLLLLRLWLSFLGFSWLRFFFVKIAKKFPSSMGGAFNNYKKFTGTLEIIKALPEVEMRKRSIRCLHLVAATTSEHVNKQLNTVINSKWMKMLNKRLMRMKAMIQTGITMKWSTRALWNM